MATINRATPQFIICELMLPKMDGFTVRSQLNEKSGLGQIPFMLLSRKKDDASVDRSIDLGIEYYLKKPFFLNEILGIVNRRCRNVPA